MLDNPKSHLGARGWIAFALLFCLISFTYSNTFDAPWHLDDYQNITLNPRVQIERLDLSSLSQPFLSSLKNGRADRPLSFLSLSVNWYFGGNNPFGYHLVNISIHILSSFFLFLTILNLFQTPKLKHRYGAKEIYFISLLSAVMWAVNPIQTQAVTYIVQRMASMAAMFYIASLFLYIKGRLSVAKSKRVLFFLGCLFSFFLGFASKENAATLPLAILLLETIFFQDLSKPGVLRTFGLSAIGAVVLILLFGSLLFLNGNPLNLLNYGIRDFSPMERLLTQPRIILFYLSLIFYPAPTRLSIEHDVLVSTSLFHPWTTLPSILIVFALICLAAIKMRRWPIVAFSILFFFLNHAIESSIVGLELIFEHRNYLPSTFLFFPVAAGINSLMCYYHKKKSWMHWLIAVFMTLVIVGFGFGTYVRNIAWTSGKYLWEDAMKKAPAASRPLHNLAWDYYQRIGRNDKALDLYFKALHSSTSNLSQESLILNNIAGIYYSRDDYENAAKYWAKAAESYSNYTEVRYRLALSQTRLGELNKALDNVDAVLLKKPTHFEANNLKGIILLKLNRVEEALPYLRKCLKMQPTRKDSLLNVGVALHRMGRFGKAAWFFKYAYFRYPNDTLILMWLINNQLKDGHAIKVNYYVDKLIDLVGVNRLPDTIKHIPKIDLYADSMVAPGVDASLLHIIGMRLNRKMLELGRLDSSVN